MEENFVNKLSGFQGMKNSLPFENGRFLAKCRARNGTQMACDLHPIR
jgi:hypothetical protein